MTVEALLAVANAYQATVLTLRQRSVDQVARIYDTTVVDAGDASRRLFAARAAAAVAPLNAAAANAALAYIPAAVRSQGIIPADLTNLNPADYIRARGVPLEDVFDRPHGRIRTSLSRGEDLATAIAKGRSEAIEYAATDPMLSTRVAVRDAMIEEPTIRGYRRVTDGAACDFCLLAATQRYRIETGEAGLMPLHPSCGCTVAPIMDVVDPGQVIDRDSLNKLKARGVTDDIERRRRGEPKGKERPPLGDRDLDDRRIKPVIGDSPEIGPTVRPEVSVDGKTVRPKRKPPRKYATDDPDVVAAAERAGVAPDDILVARQRIPDVKASLYDAAEEVQIEAFEQLDHWDARHIRRPPKGKRPAEYDFLETLDARERARLSRHFYTDNPVDAPDVLVERMAQNSGAYYANLDDGIDEWLDATRRYEAAGALRRGKLPSDRAYSGTIDPDTLIDADGYSVRTIFGDADELDIAGHIAAVDNARLADEAVRMLGPPPTHGPAPYRMSFQAWEREVRDLEYGLREFPGDMPKDSRARLAELIPFDLDDGQDYEDLYATITTTARRAGEEVPAYARIPWA